MSTSREYDNPGRYEIVVKGRLDPVWFDWFDGFSTEPGPDNETVLRGQVADQAALHGVLSKIRDLGLPLLSVKLIGMDAISPVPGEHHEEQSGQERQTRVREGGGHAWLRCA